MFQSYALFPHLSVAGNIAFGLRMQRLPAAETRARVARVVGLTALDGLLDRLPAQLSGGQRQRVALARALVCEPRVLLLDEPLSALDARLRAQVRGELRALQRRLGRTFVFVTHDQEEALTLSDRVAVMRAGRVEQIGGVEDIYHRPANLFVAQFVGEANVIGAVVVNTGNGRFVCQLTGDAEGYLEVQTSAKHPALETGTCVTLLVRPERIRLHADQPPADEVNALTVSVKERVFQGAATTLTLNVLASNVPMGLRALASHETRIAAAPVGATLHVCIAPEDIVIVEVTGKSPIPIRPVR